MKHNYKTIIFYNELECLFDIYLVHSILVDSTLSIKHETSIFRDIDNRVINLCKEQALGDKFLLIQLPSVSVDTFHNNYTKEVTSQLLGINELHYSNVKLEDELLTTLIDICDNYISMITGLSAISPETIQTMCLAVVNNLLSLLPIIDVRDIITE